MARLDETLGPPGTDDVPLVDGTVPIQTDWFELEDGVQIRFDPNGESRVGDYWLILRERARAPSSGRMFTTPPGQPASVPRHPPPLLHARPRPPKQEEAWTEVAATAGPSSTPLTDLDRAGGCCVDRRRSGGGRPARDRQCHRAAAAASFSPLRRRPHRPRSPLYRRRTGRRRSAARARRRSSSSWPGRTPVGAPESRWSATARSTDSRQRLHRPRRHPDPMERGSSPSRRCPGARNSSSPVRKSSHASR